MPIKILVVDPLEVARAGVRVAVESSSDLQIVGEFSDIRSAESQILSLQPDVILIDFDGDLNRAVLTISELSGRYSQCRWLICSTQDGADVATAMMRSGASGFISKAARLDELVMAIRGVYLGRIFISHAPEPSGANAPPHMPSGDQVKGPSVEGLSQRERQVLSLIAEGFTNKQMAQLLFLSVKTVETYRSRVMRKAGLADRAAAIRFVRQIGLREAATVE